MFFNLKNKIGRYYYNLQCKDILKTKPLTLNKNNNLAIITQLQHKDLLLYLTALKSFARQIGPSYIYILNDGSLTSEDIDILKTQIPGISFLELEDFQNEYCPKGGCWERLLAIVELVKEHYVVQLDSDTLTLASIDEVKNCISTDKAFVLGTRNNQNFETMEEICIDAKKHSSGLSQDNVHVQVMVEENLDKIDSFKTLKYVRGCAGFTGFPMKSLSKEFIEEMSKKMESSIGKKWHDWGSEQVMSNIAVANIENAMVLPHPKYSNSNKMVRNKTVFAHFIGSHRFKNGDYAALSKNLIDSMN